MLLALILSTIIVALTYAIGRHLHAIWLYRHIPGVSQLLPFGPMKIPILAPYMYLGSYKEILALGERFSQYPVYRITSGWSTAVVLNNLEAVKHVMSKNASNYTKPPIYHALMVYVFLVCFFNVLLFCKVFCKAFHTYSLLTKCF